MEVKYYSQPSISTNNEQEIIKEKGKNPLDKPYRKTLLTSLFIIYYSYLTWRFNLE